MSAPGNPMPRRVALQAMTVVVHPDAADLADGAAREAAGVLRDAVAERGRAHAMFATGNSQLAMVERLVELEGVPWSRTTVFHMDEYVGMGPGHPASFQKWRRERISERVHPGDAHYLDGLADPATECDRYAELLRQMPLDLCCLGVGENGHLAFNDPPAADFHDPMRVKVVELDDACRDQQVGEGHFPDLAQVPTLALTVTIPALLCAARVLAVVPERRKAAPVKAALEGPVSTACPASVLRTRGNVTAHLDPESASQVDLA
jgi:glucosamine-6-phosphate deaminase